MSARQVPSGPTQLPHWWFCWPWGFFTVRYATPFIPFLYASLALICVRIATAQHPSENGSIQHALRKWLSWILCLTLLIGGSVSFLFRGNYIYERALTPHAAQASEFTQCDSSSAVVADGEFTYIDSYYYYHDCDNYHFLKQDDASSRGGYAPLHGSMTQVRDLDDLSSKTIYYLTRSSNDKKQKTTEYRNTDHYSAGEYRVKVFERR